MQRIVFILILVLSLFLTGTALADPLPVAHPSLCFAGSWEDQDHSEQVRVQFGVFSVINNALEVQQDLVEIGIETELFVAPTLSDTDEEMVIVVSAEAFEGMQPARDLAAGARAQGFDGFPRSFEVYGSGLSLDDARYFFGL